MISDGYTHARLVHGYWWSNTSITDITTYFIDTHPTYAFSHDGSRGAGFAIRCVVREG